MRVVSSVILLWLLCVCLAGAQDEQKPDSGDSLLVDATYVPCSDTAECLLILHDGRTIYSNGTQAVVYSLVEGVLADFRSGIRDAESIVDRRFLDSCNTVGVILPGPRYLLINNARPSLATRELQSKLERVRRLGLRNLQITMDRMIEKIDTAADRRVAVRARVAEGDAIPLHVYPSPITTEWKCRGTVVATIRVDQDGVVRRAFVEQAESRGKCAAMLAANALYAILLTRFEPARRSDDKPVAQWIQVEVEFTRNSW